MKKSKHTCCFCNKPIIKERVDILLNMGVHELDLTCVEHSTTKPLQGIYLGENGTSELLLVNKVYDDSVRSMFKSSREPSNEQEEDSEPEPKESYSQKELSYYVPSEEIVDPEEKVEIIKRQQT